MMLRRLICVSLAGAGLAGCVAYQEPVAYAPPPRPVYAAPGPVYVAPPPERVYVQPRPRRQWVPRRCDGYGRCWGGYWR
ncbi:hypothetical protein [Roseomonas sp. CECT 9278]|uniref:hypothetical protein n=1 Tax=Roseomonas sp. CECT 9278 TaxID=2845823 RepID=UPI001E3916A3|nr:hypothetical protein [Roseomonas sp. CECT 9278]CAH0204522.1 hypothetical protein ROS9278_02006 [Roseomonas sp. CECT 9278]